MAHTNPTQHTICHSPMTPPDSSTSEEFPKDSQQTIRSTNDLYNPRTASTKPESIPTGYSCKENPVSYYKTFGYRAFCQLIANEQTFFIVRRFGGLNARVGLFLQNKIVQLEDRLNELDKDNAHELLGDVNNGSFREEHDSRRTKLIEEELLPGLLKYNKFVNSYAQLVNRAPVRPEARKQVHSWLAGHKAAIQDEEASYISMADDLIAVHPKEKSWFRKILEWTFVAKLPFFRRDPPGYEFNGSKEVGRVDFQNDSGLERCSSAIIAIIGLSMLIGPLWILNTVKRTEVQLGVITAFVTLFFVLVAVATNAKIFESLGAAAAYSAVLMVFLQMSANGR